MNKRDLKKLKIDDSFVIDPMRFLIGLGVECSHLNKQVGDHDLHYILQGSLHHASVKSVSIDKIYRGEIILIGKPNNFHPYYNPVRCKVNVSKHEEVKKLEKCLEEMNIIELYLCYSQTFDEKYLNEIYDRCYNSIEEEVQPTRNKIYCHTKKGLEY